MTTTFAPCQPSAIIPCSSSATALVLPAPVEPTTARVPEDELGGVKANRDVGRRGERAEADQLLPLAREDVAQVLGCGEVHRVIEARVAGDAALKALEAVDFSEQLHLQPALADLDVLDRRQR